MISKVNPVVEDIEAKNDWFEKWFNSPYYHILYKNRNEDEAEAFLDTLVRFIRVKPGARILDVACGRGRHSIYLNKMGFDVTGFDLSPASIRHNKPFENEYLTFYLHDMREVFRANYFDLALNLFSSFGYFEKERDNLRCIIANATALKPGGCFVFDYFNAKRVRESGESVTETEIDGIRFRIEKIISGNFIRKKIFFTHGGNPYQFEENLLLADKEILEKYFRVAGLEIQNIFGSYTLENYHEKKSERLIILATKK
jgi:SAM-dependent methyltransferase